MMQSFWTRGGLLLLVALTAAPVLADETKRFHGEASVNVIEIPVSVIDKETGQGGDRLEGLRFQGIRRWESSGDFQFL